MVYQAEGRYLDGLASRILTWQGAPVGAIQAQADRLALMWDYALNDPKMLGYLLDSMGFPWHGKLSTYGRRRILQTLGRLWRQRGSRDGLDTLTGALGMTGYWYEIANLDGDCSVIQNCPFCNCGPLLQDQLYDAGFLDYYFGTGIPAELAGVSDAYDRHYYDGGEAYPAGYSFLKWLRNGADYSTTNPLQALAESSDVTFTAVYSLSGTGGTPPEEEEPPVGSGKYSGGDGTAISPYLISTAADWAELVATTTDYSKYFRLINDLDFGGATISPTSISTAFTGTFNGGSYTISHFTLTSTGQLGLFGWNTGTIYNLRLYNVTVLSSGTKVGALAGINAGTIKNCSVETGTVTGGASGFIGGLIGEQQAGLVSQCWADVTVTGPIRSGRCIGGLSSSSAVIEDCYARGAGTCGGGFIGFMLKDDGGCIRRCYAAPRATGASGGFCGEYNVGTPVPVVACYWDTQTSGTANSTGLGTTCGALGRTSDQMTYAYSVDTYVGWDFDAVWIADTEHSVNNGYPYVDWLYVTLTFVTDGTVGAVLQGVTTQRIPAGSLATAVLALDPPPPPVIPTIYYDIIGSSPYGCTCADIDGELLIPDFDWWYDFHVLELLGTDTAIREYLEEVLQACLPLTARLRNLRLITAPWMREPDMPTLSVYKSAGANLNDHLVLFGGTTKASFVDPGVASKDIWVYEPVSQVYYQHPAQLSIARINACTAVLGDEVYVIGGESVTGTTIPRIEIFKMDSTGTLTAHFGFHVSNPEYCTQAAAVTVGSDVLILGGKRGTPTNVAYLVHYTGMSWVVDYGVNFILSRYGHAAVILGDYIYVLGGRTAAGATATVERILTAEIQTGTWANVAAMPAATERTFAHALNGKIYVWGNLYGGASNEGVVYVYDPATDEWETKTSLPNMAGPACAGWRNGFYLFGSEQTTYPASLYRAYKYFPDME